MEIRPLDFHEMGTIEYDITHYQPTLFAAESKAHLVDAVGALLRRVQRRHADSGWPRTGPHPPPLSYSLAGPRMVARLKLAILLALVGALCALCAGAASGAVKFQRIAGYDDPATPDDLDRVGVLKVGPKKAPNVLVLNPGHLGERRVLRAAGEPASSKQGDGLAGVGGRAAREPARGPLGGRPGEGGERRPASSCSTTTSATSRTRASPTHYQPVPDSEVPFARGWGMQAWRSRTCAGSCSRPRSSAARWSSAATRSAGSITTAYATWDFNGRPGAEGLAGLVFIDGGSEPDPDHAEAGDASARLRRPRRRLSVARVRRHPGPVRGPVQRRRLDRGAPRSRTASARCRPGRRCPPT